MMREHSSLCAQALDAMQRHSMVSPGETVLVAVSGGADSTALLLAFWELKQALSICVEAAHFEHGIRGEASLADMRHVQALCQSLGVPCHVGRADVPALSKQWKCGLEDAARRARYAFLEETAKKTGASKIALAHHMDDQAETLLLHLVRGCGLDGLAAMRPVRGNRIRPLLSISRADLEAYLREKGVAWREDETNHQSVHARNLLRHEVFPVLRRLNPRVSEAMARAAEQAARAADFFAKEANFQHVSRVKSMAYGAFWHLEGIDPTIEGVRAFAAWAGVPPLSARQSQALFDLLPGGSTNLPSGFRALRTKTRLHLLHGKAMHAPVFPQEDFLFVPDSPHDFGDGIHLQAFDEEAISGAAFRTRREGDVFAPLGGTGTQRLSQTLRDAGIDLPFRDLLPVLAKGNRVLWIVGVKPSRDAAVTPQTKKAVSIRYTGELPWEIQRRTPIC